MERVIIEKALDCAMEYGGIDGEHHKMWVIDQMVRILSGKNYDHLIKDHCDGEDGANTYDWDTAIAPQKENKMDWTQVLTVFAVIATNLGTVITLYCQLDKKLDEQRRETNDILKGIREEMKDFHGRLCAIEERNRK